MEKKCQMDDNVSSSDQISHGLTSSISENIPNIRNVRDADVSTVSSERVHSSEHSSLRSDVGSVTVKTFSGKRRKSESVRVTEVSQEDSTATVPYPHKQLKADSSSSKESVAAAQLSSVGSVALNPAQPLSNCGSSHPTQSDASKNVFQEPESSVTVRSDAIAVTVQKSPHEFDLNEDMEDIGEDCHPFSIEEPNSSRDALHPLEPIPVVAKVGVPVGLPEKPLQFDGELGWRSLGISAFRSTLLKSPDTEKGNGGNFNDCNSKTSLCREFDLNIAATMDVEVTVDQTPVSPQKPESSYDFNSQRGTANRHQMDTSAIDLNNNPMMDQTCKSIYRQGEARQVSRNCYATDSATCSGASACQLMSDSRRSPYWVDLSSVQGYGHVQGQPLFLGAPTAEQMQMMVPIQLSQTPPGYYFGKFNGLTPTLYPSNALPPLHNQQGVAAIPQISGPVLAAYPGNVHLLESSQGLSPHPYANLRQTILPNGSIALVGNGSRGVNSAEFLIPARNSLFEERMKAEQVAFTNASMKRREPDAGWGSPQINCRQMASWN